MNQLLTGQTAVVTGAAQGIGFAITQRMVSNGADVVMADLDAERITAAALAIDKSAGGSAIALECDVTNPDDVDGVVTQAAGNGRLHLWVNNAGISRDASLKKMTVQDFRAVLDVNTTGTWLAVRAASAITRETRTGSIVNLSSLSRKSGNPGQTNYITAKAAIFGLTKAAAKELAHHNVRVNAVAPGLIRTAMTQAMPPELFAAERPKYPCAEQERWTTWRTQSCSWLAG